MASKEALLEKDHNRSSLERFQHAGRMVELRNRFVRAAEEEAGLLTHHAKTIKFRDVKSSFGLAPPPDEKEAAALQTNTEAIVNLLNNCLGSGMLGVAFAVKKAGVVPALLIILFSAAINRYTLLLNLQSCLTARVDPATAAIGEATFGKAGKLFMVILFTCLGFFCMVSYIDASADAVAGLLRLGGVEFPKSALLATCWAIMLVPPTLMRSLKMVAVLSFVAFVGGCVMLACVLVYCGSNLMASGLPAAADVAWLPPDWGSLFAAAPILLLIFSTQAGGGVVLSTMEDDSEANARSVTLKAYVIVLVMDLLMGFVSYLAFLGETKGDVLENMAADSPTAVVARVALVVLVVLSYMIMAIPCKVALIDLLFGKNEALNEASPAQFYSLTLVLNVAALLVALAVSDLAAILSLNGAVCTNFVAFILPAAFYVRVHKEASLKEKLPFAALLGFGVLSLTVCSAQI